MKFLASALFSASLVAAHGYVDNATIGGESFTFYQPYQDPYIVPTPERVSRPVQGNGPVTDVTIADIQCGGYSDGGIVGSSPAALHANATAGSDVTLFWTLWPESHFGALVTYMARCPDTGCQDFMPNSTAVWFKIAEDGLVDKTTNEWGVTPLMKAGNAGYTYTIPECLAPGFYLVRHEIIAVFVANVYPGAQLYPGCHQLQVSGSGSTVPTDLVSFPGAYAPEDGGITWSTSEDTYPVPGPAVFSCSGSSASGNATVSATQQVTSTAPTSSASSSSQLPATSSSSSLVTGVAAVASTLSSTVSAAPTTLVSSVKSATETSPQAAQSSSSPTTRCSRKRSLHGSGR